MALDDFLKKWNDPNKWAKPAQTGANNNLVNLQNEVSKKLGIALAGTPQSEEEIVRKAAEAIKARNPKTIGEVAVKSLDNLSGKYNAPAPRGIQSNAPQSSKPSKPQPLTQNIATMFPDNPFVQKVTNKIKSGQQLTPGELNAARTFNIIESADNTGNRVLNDIKAGFGDVLSSIGGAAQYLGAENIGKEMQQRGEATSAIWGQSNPNLGDDLVRALPFTLSLLPATMAAGSAGAGLAGARGLGTVGKVIAGSIAGGAASRPLESLMEAGSTYNGARARGFSVEDAEKAADSVFKNNMKLGIMDVAELATAFLPVPQNIKNTVLRTTLTGGGKAGNIARFLARLGLTGAQEGLEEGIQENIQRSALGDEVSWTDPQVKRAMEVGAIFGIGMGTVGAAHQAFRNSVAKRMSPEMQKTFDTLKDHYTSQGMPPEQAEIKVINDLAAHPEGERIIQDAVPEAVELFNQDIAGKALNLSIADILEQGTGSNVEPLIKNIPPVQTVQTPEAEPIAQSVQTIPAEQVVQPEQIMQSSINQGQQIEQNEQTGQDKIRQAEVQPPNITSGQKYILKNFGEVEVVNADDPTKVIVRNKNGSEIPLTRKVFDSLVQKTQSEAQIESPASVDILPGEKYNISKAENSISQDRTNVIQGGDTVVTGIQGRDAAANEEALSRLEQRITQGDSGSIPQGTRVFELAGDEKTSKEVQAAEQIANLFGHKFVHFSVNQSLKTTNKDLYDKANNFNGAVIDDTILINSDRTNPAHAVTGHEIVHEIAKNKEIYEPFIKELKSLVSQEGHDAVKALVDVYKDNGVTITEDDAWQEFAGDFVGEQMTKESFWERLAQKAPEAVKKAIDVIKKIIAGLRKRVNEGHSVEKFITDLERAHELAVNAAARYLEDNAIASAEASGTLTETDKALLNYLRVHEKKTLTEAINDIKLEINNKIEQTVKYLKKEIDEGEVTKYGQVIGPDEYPTGEWYSGGSTHAKWYRDFWADHNKKPNNQDLREIAEDWLRNGVPEGEAAHGMEIPPDEEFLGLEDFLSELQEIEQRLSNSVLSPNVRTSETDNGESEEVRFSIKDNNSQEGKGNRVKEQLAFDFSIEAEKVEKQLELNFPEIKGKRETKDAAKAITEAKVIEQGRRNISSEGGKVDYARFERSGIKTLGVGFTDEFAKKGRIDYIGQKITSDRDLAALAQMFRDPRFETMRYFYIKNGVLVAHEGISSRVPSTTRISLFGKRSDVVKDIKNRIKRTGADTLYLLHNHPSGDPKPSQEDINVTGWLTEEIPEIKGHVIIDHSKYVLLQPKGIPGHLDLFERDLGLPGKDDKLTPSIPHADIRSIIRGPGDVASIGNRLVNDPNRVIVIYMGAKGHVNAIQDIPIGMLKNKKGLTDYLRGRAREFSGYRVLTVCDLNVKKQPQYQQVLNELIRDNILTDAVYIDTIKKLYYESEAQTTLPLPQKGQWMGAPEPKAKKFSEEASDYASDIRFQLKADPFYSKLERTIETKMPEKTTAAQVLRIVDNPQNVKPEEVKWSGIRLWLQGKDKVTKAEILEFLRGNVLRIKEVERGGTYKYTPEQSKRLDELTAKQTEITERVIELYKSEFNEEMPFSVIASDNRRAMFGQFKGRGFSDKGREILGKLRDEFDDSENEIDEIVNKGREKSETKFSQYVLPGGENYRELLFILPDKVPKLPNGYKLSQLRKNGENIFTLIGPDNVGEVLDFVDRAEAYSEAINRLRKKGLISPKDTFQSSHWDEPNVLAHTRFNERTTPDGEKVFFIEEIQSDWHQKGRDSGYRDEELIRKIEKERELLKKQRDELIAKYNKHGNLIAARQQMTKEERDLEREISDKLVATLDVKAMVPDAPFRKTWHEFVLKRLIRLAAENDFDYMAWTTGGQQAERYDLSKQVESIYFNKKPFDYEEGKIWIVVNSKNNNDPLIRKNMTVKEIEETLGKEIAQKITDSEERGTIEGEGLKIGGEGMKAFYDIGGKSSQNIPAFLNKYVKQWGSKVEEIELKGGLKQPAIRITDAMKKSALYEGQPLFQLKSVNWEELKNKAKSENKQNNKVPDLFSGQTPESEKLGFIPAGFRVKLPGQQTSSFDSHAFENENIEKEYRASYGVKEPTMAQKAKEGSTEFWHMFTRTFRRIKPTKENANFIKEMVLYPKLLQKSGDYASRMINEFIKDLGPKRFNIFRRKVLLDDLAEEIKLGHELPGNWTPEDVERELQRIEPKIDEFIRKALEKRKAGNQQIVNEYIEAMKGIGKNLEKRFTRENYFRHQVLDFMEAKQKIPGSSKARVKSSTAHGWLRERKGSGKSINTDYLQAEYEVLSQLRFETEKAQMLQRIEKQYSIYNQCVKQANSANKQTIDAIIQNEMELPDAPKDDKGNPISPTEQAIKKFNQGMAIGFSRLSSLAQKGELWSGQEGKYDDVIDHLAKMAEKNNELEGFSEETHPDMFKYLSVLVKQNGETGQQEAAQILKNVSDRKEFIKGLLGDKYRTWEDMIPDGYRTWQPLEGRAFYMANVIPNQMAQDLLAGILEEVGLRAEDINAVMAVGRKNKQYVLPVEIADTMDDLHTMQPQTVVSKVVKELLSKWKGWVLTGNPHTVLKYNLRNLSGDLDGVLGAIGLKGISPKLINRAARELYDAMKNMRFSKDMQEWWDRGGFQSLLAAQEITDVNKLKPFRMLGEEKSLPGKMANLPKSYFEFTRDLTDYREGILRYAAYLYYKEHLKQNNGLPKFYGASLPDIIQGLDTIEDRAYQLSKDALGAYDEVTEFGRLLRQYVIPFYSWNEINFKRYKRLFQNALNNEQLQENAGKALARTMKISGLLGAKTLMTLGRVGLRVWMLSVLMLLWNAMFPDEEDDLPEDVRTKPHIILGRDSEGNVGYFSRLGALNDFLDWFGLDNLTQDIQDLQEGKKDMGEQVSDMAFAPINKLINGLTPYFMIPAQLMAGQTYYPDVRKPGKIRDVGEFVASSVGLTEEYKRLAGKPVRESYVKSWEKALLYKADPNESAYYYALDLKQKFEKQVQNKYPSGVFSDSPKSKALYYFKQSLRFKDTEKAYKYLVDYFNEGGTAKGIIQSLQTMSPLYGLDRKEQQAYYDWLNERDRDKVRDALKYYRSVVRYDPKNKAEKQIYGHIEKIISATEGNEEKRKRLLMPAIKAMIKQ